MKWLTCQEVTGLFSESMDRTLPWGQRISLWAHFLICKWCTRYRQQLLSIRRAMRQQPDKLLGQEPSAGLSPEARERLKQALRQRQKH
jgi:ABC-type branched-subunit amino acid transport system ATPase component